MNQQEASELVQASEIVQNQDPFYWVAMISSIVIIVIGVYFLWRKLQSHSSGNTKEGFEIFTLFMLGATTVIFLPVYYLPYSCKHWLEAVKPAFQSICSAMRVFVLNEDFGIVKDSSQKMQEITYMWFSSYAAILYAIAPAIFTFTIFHSFFRDTNTKLQFRIHWKPNLYVFSCLNEDSATMALSILQPKNENTKESIKGKNMIVFCDVPRDNEKREVLTDLLPYKRNKNAKVLFMRKTVDKVDVTHFKNAVTFFLMDKSETKNIQDATELCNRLKDQRTTKKSETVPLILVYASSPASGPLIDALCRTMNKSVPDKTVKQLIKIINNAYKQNKKISDILDETQDGIRQAQTGNTQNLSFSEPFSIMRIDTKHQMAMMIVQDFQNDFRKNKTIESAMRGQGSFTITLLGLGGIGKEILGTILWMCQVYGCRLIINVFDAIGPELGDDPDAAHNPLYDQLAYEWPELMETNRNWQMHPLLRPCSEAYYDIRFFFGTDCFSNRFRRLFDLESNVSGRLLQSSLIICSLGNDDKNLEAAMMMRQLFEGKSVEYKHDSIYHPSYPQPEIYAIVYDEQRSDCILNQGEISNYKNIPYRIKIKGSRQSQFSYPDIKKMVQLEKEAIIHHISWILASKDLKVNPWCYKEFRILKNERIERPLNYMKDTGVIPSHQKKRYRILNKYTVLNNEINKYIHYEYYRHSSLAKAIHKEALKDRKLYHEASKDEGQRRLSRITEHMRWNAYMRVNGYRRYEQERNDMAKIHNDLVPWNKLSEDDKNKD